LARRGGLGGYRELREEGFGWRDVVEGRGAPRGTVVLAHAPQKGGVVVDRSICVDLPVGQRR
jgi:hypothetical protein